MNVNVDDVLELIRETGRQMRDDAGDNVLAAVKDACPVSSAPDIGGLSHTPGRLRDSLEIMDTIDEPDRFTVSIGSTLEYASFTDEDDTNPHLIFPVAAKSLRFWWDAGPHGAGVYNYRFVMHPGTQGQHWFETKNQDRWDEALREVSP